MNSSSEDRYAIRSVDRALDIIECVAGQNGALTVDQITEATDLPKSTVFRVLATLTARQFVDRDPRTQTYRLGTLALVVGARALGDLDIRRVARRHIEQLMAESGETVHLAVLSQASALCIDKIDSTRSVRMSSFVGFRDPLHCSGVGKALLAFQDDAAQQTLIAGMTLEPRTPHTITDRAALAEQLSRIRENGFATDVEEIEEGLCCIAAPIRDHSGKAIAGVSISGPTTRVHADTFATLIPLVKACADWISRDLGFQGEKT
ncbi:IclR family transcriptional regulator [Kaistia sp. 32K]|uniref:IclR family transcriptional regulator n=1 Tax=Kaistia sp. 32K TaxID=2795690 RepID=UPI0019154280|nr:IclR family transcriptional regulator [Kaistia sp. 32K]BCP51473.1 IclR family transcriptional regulator [Kaistia sp. 32K]